jgi:hypothetical protein
MKRLLLTFAFVLVATAAFGQVTDRDVLVTPSGTVFTVASQIPPADADNPVDALQTLTLTVQNGSEVNHLLVPASTSSGSHFGAALAYDTESSTLFVLWIHMPNAMSSELLLAPYRDGKWQSAVSVDSEPYRFRNNLRLGITRSVAQLQKDGTYADVPALLLHAVWWEESGKGEEARYALMTIEKGTLQLPIETHSLEEFVAPADEVSNTVDPTFNKELLRHPAIVSPPMQSSVDVIFGDTRSNAIHGVTLHPIADARVHIPIGIGAGPGNGPKIKSLAAPPTFNADWKGPITIIERGDRLVFANASETALSYLTYANGAWSDVKSIGIDSHFPAEAALAAIDKMVSTQ